MLRRDIEGVLRRKFKVQVIAREFEYKEREFNRNDEHSGETQRGNTGVTGDITLATKITRKILSTGMASTNMQMDSTGSKSELSERLAFCPRESESSN